MEKPVAAAAIGIAHSRTGDWGRGSACDHAAPERAVGGRQPHASGGSSGWETYPSESCQSRRPSSGRIRAATRLRYCAFVSTGTGAPPNLTWLSTERTPGVSRAMRSTESRSADFGTEPVT